MALPDALSYSDQNLTPQYDIFGSRNQRPWEKYCAADHIVLSVYRLPACLWEEAGNAAAEGCSSATRITRQFTSFMETDLLLGLPERLARASREEDISEEERNSLPMVMLEVWCESLLLRGAWRQTMRLLWRLFDYITRRFRKICFMVI